jgi:20S proteasome subunit beta 1
VKTAAHVMGSLCYNNKDNLLAGIIIAGFDPYDGGQVFCIPLGGTLIKQDFACGGSGSTYIWGYVDSIYKKGMSKEECVKFVQHALSHAMARDGSSGGVVRTVTIDKDGCERDFIPGNKLPYMDIIQ